MEYAGEVGTEDAKVVVSHGSEEGGGGGGAVLDVVSQGSASDEAKVGIGIAVGAVYGVSTRDVEYSPWYQYGCGTSGTAADEG